MTVKLKLGDAAGEYREEFTEPAKLLRAAERIIAEKEGRCSLYVLQWDPKYQIWLAITETTETMMREIEKLQAEYIRLLEGVDRIVTN